MERPTKRPLKRRDFFENGSVPIKQSITSYFRTWRRTYRAARYGKTAWRQAERARERVGFGNASLRQNLSILWPAFFHCSDSSSQTRAAPNRGSHGRFTMPRMRSDFSTICLLRRSMGQGSPKFMSHRIDVMPDSEQATGISIAVNKLIIQLQNELPRVERERAVRVHT